LGSSSSDGSVEGAVAAAATLALAAATAVARTAGDGAGRRALLRVVGGSGRTEDGILEALVPWRCPVCFTAGWVPCGACGGRGKTGGLFTGDPLASCAACEARGARACARCDGTGCVNTWLWTPKTPKRPPTRPPDEVPR